MIEKIFEGKPWNVLAAAHRYLSESMGFKKEYKITIKIEEL